MSLRPSRASLAFACACALALPAPQAFAAPRASAGPDESAARVEHALFELGDGNTIASAELLDALVPGGADAVQQVLAALDSAYVPTAAGRPRKLERRRRDALLDALDGIPVLVLRNGLGGKLASDARLPAIEIALAIVGALGREDQLATAFALAESATSGRLERRIVRALESALATLLARHPGAHDRLAARFVEVQPALRWTVVRAVGAAGQREGLSFFANVIGESPSVDLSILTEIGRLAVAHPPPHEFGFKARLRTYLRSPDAGLRREALGALARMEDRECFGAVVELLSDPDAGVRDNALWAAQRLSGKGFGPEPAAWSAWYEAEVGWWEVEAQALIGRLRAGPGTQRLEGIGELVTHPLFRHDLAHELSQLLDNHEPSFVRSTCSALADLGSHAALPALIALLAHSNGAVREHAWHALRRITGEDRPATREAWVELLP